MRVLLFGATGMVGQGVLRECLLAADVQEVVAVGRTPLAQEHGKLHQVLHSDMLDFQPLENLLQGFDACFFCLGVSSAGMNETKYTHLTYDLTLVAASTLARLNPQMTFIYVSGAGTDSSEAGKSMWARVKGKTENALLRLPFKAVYLFRPGGDPTVAWRALEDAVVPVVLHGARAVAVGGAWDQAGLGGQHRDRGAGDAGGGA